MKWNKDWIELNSFEEAVERNMNNRRSKVVTGTQSVESSLNHNQTLVSLRRTKCCEYSWADFLELPSWIYCSTNLSSKSNTRPVISLDFSWFQDFLQISLCLKVFLEEKQPPREERSSLYCVQTSSFLFVGMWRVCKSSKIKHPGGSGGFVL